MLTNLREKIKDDDSNNPKVLLVQYYLAGAIHTKVAYTDYMNKFSKNEVNLYSELLDNLDKYNGKKLDLYYIRPDKFAVSDMKGFDKVLYLDEVRHEINQFDYFDGDLSRLWWYDEFSSKYYEIK